MASIPPVVGPFSLLMGIEDWPLRLEHTRDVEGPHYCDSETDPDTDFSDIVAVSSLYWPLSWTYFGQRPVHPVRYLSRCYNAHDITMYGVV